MKSRLVMALATLAMLAGTARADEVTLKNGRKIVGIAREEGKQIIVELPLGTATFEKDEVLSILPGRTALHEYAEKADAIKDSRNAKDYAELALWAKANGLTRYTRPNFEKALALDPENELARRGLGFTLQNGKWMTEDEVRRSQGFVKYEGRWVTQLEMELIARRKLDAEVARLAAEEERARKKEEQAEARRKALQEYYDRQAEMRRMREVYQPYYGYGRPYYQGYYGYGQDVYLTYDIFSLLNGLGYRYGTTFVPVPAPVLPRRLHRGPGAPGTRR